GLLGAGLGAVDSGFDRERRSPAVASIFVTAMSAAALTARQVVVRMIVFNMASSPRRRNRAGARPRRCASDVPPCRRNRARLHRPWSAGGPTKRKRSCRRYFRGGSGADISSDFAVFLPGLADFPGAGLAVGDLLTSARSFLTSETAFRTTLRLILPRERCFSSAPVPSSLLRPSPGDGAAAGV